MQNLEVPGGHCGEVKSIYISEVMVDINTKRCTIRQSAGKVVQRKTVCHTWPNLASNPNANYYSSVVMPSEHMSHTDSSYMKALEIRLQRIAEGGVEEPTPIFFSAKPM